MPSIFSSDLQITITPYADQPKLNLSINDFGAGHISVNVHFTVTQARDLVTLMNSVIEQAEINGRKKAYV